MLTQCWSLVKTWISSDCTCQQRFTTSMGSQIKHYTNCPLLRNNFIRKILFSLKWCSVWHTKTRIDKHCESIIIFTQEDIKFWLFDHFNVVLCCEIKLTYLEQGPFGNSSTIINSGHLGCKNSLPPRNVRVPTYYYFSHLLMRIQLASNQLSTDCQPIVNQLTTTQP